ncbi:hypothetical protein B0H14DRAFT_3423336 [Mycena olivaceomarginata]|nr:hypothetical protein B0H14DRAFT_3423336 [Mycena olivaceomarginata]
MKIPIVHTDGKLSMQSKKLRLIAYHGAGAYRLLDLETGKFYKSRDVFFEEGKAHRTGVTDERSPEDFGEAWGSENDLAPPPAPPLPLPVAPATSERIPTPPVIVPAPLVAAPTRNAPLFTVGIAAGHRHPDRSVIHMSTLFYFRRTTPLSNAPRLRAEFSAYRDFGGYEALR